MLVGAAAAQPTSPRRPAQAAGALVLAISALVVSVSTQLNDANLLYRQELFIFYFLFSFKYISPVYKSLNEAECGGLSAGGIEACVQGASLSI